MSNLTKEDRLKLEELSNLVTSYYDTPEPAKIGVIRKLSKDREIINSIYVEQDVMYKVDGLQYYSKEEMTYVSEIDSRVMPILEPIYKNLLKKAINDFKKWIMESNGTEPYHYQLQTVYQLLKIIIYKSRADIIYTLLISRGGGKTYSVSGLATFLMFNWDKYILHNKNLDYGIAISTFVDKQLDEFRKNVKGNISSFFQINGKGAFNDKLNNDDEIVIYKNNRPYSKCVFRIATSSMESVHVDLLLSDEAKFYPRTNLHRSVLPCVNGRTGIKVLISSADEYYSEYQNIVERNIREYKKDGIVRHIEFHWKDMVKYNPSYKIAVMGALAALDGNRNDPSFATQYDNKFLSKGGSSFFGMEYMKNIRAVQNYDPLRYMTNEYVIIGGYDIAVTGDSSILTFKAIPNGMGENRKSFLLASIVMNPSKNEEVDIMPRQIPRVCELMAHFNCKAIVVDCTGLGNGADLLLKEEVRNNLELFKDGFDENNIIGFKYAEKNKTDILDYYMNRLKSGLEILPDIHDYETLSSDDSYCESVYKSCYNNPDEDMYPQMVRFLVEHKNFTRKAVINEATKTTKTVFVQAQFKWLHDDTIFSSAKASWVLRLFPYLTNYSDDGFEFGDYGSGGNYMFVGD